MVETDDRAGLGRLSDLMNCPTCGLTNPPAALVCDCGYDFTSSSDVRGWDIRLAWRHKMVAYWSISWPALIVFLRHSWHYGKPLFYRDVTKSVGNSYWYGLSCFLCCPNRTHLPPNSKEISYLQHLYRPR